MSTHAPELPIEVDDDTGVWTTNNLPMLYVPRHFFLNNHMMVEAAIGREAYAEALEKVANLADDDTSKEADVARAMTLSFRDWARLNEFRTGLRWAWHRFFQDYDVLLTPMCVTAAFPHDHNPKMGARRLTVNGEERDYFEQLFWAGMTGVSLLPSTVMPGGMTADNLPVGLHIVGPEMGDRKTITVAKLLSQRFGGFQAPARMS